MSDMPKKLPYFVNSGGKPKLKRAVPSDIRDLVGKQNWVQSVGTLSPAQLKVEANKFAVFTDAEIERYRMRPLGQVEVPTETKALSLRSSDVDEIISRYRGERQTARLLNRSLLLPEDRTAQDVLGDAQDDLLNALKEATGETSVSEDKTIRLMQRYGFAEETQGWSGLRRIADALENNVEFQRLVRLKEIADIQFAQDRVNALSNRDFSTIQVAPIVAASTLNGPSKHKSVSLKSATESFLASKPDDLTVSRRSQLKLAIDILHEWFGEETLVNEIDREQCRDLVAFIPKIPAYRAQHYKGLTLREAAEAHVHRHGNYADRRDEGQKYVEIARSIFQFAKDEQWLLQNPWAGLEVPKKTMKKYLEAEKSYHPFPMASLNKLFALPIWLAGDDGRPVAEYFLTHRYWTPIIALYSGMRMNEILQLEKSDVLLDGDITVFAVTDEESGKYDPKLFSKRVKTKNSIRRVPMHPKLIEFGFMKWVQKAAAGRLFPEAVKGAGEKPSDLYSKRFHTDLLNAEIWVPRRQVFHSFRGTFNDALRAGGTSEELRDAINGWKRQRSMDKAYGRGHTNEMLFAEVRNAEFPGFDTSALERNAKLI
jgi:integrase